GYDKENIVSQEQSRQIAIPLHARRTAGGNADCAPARLLCSWRCAMSMTPCFRVAVLAGLVAGTAATLAQLLLWWLASVPLPDVLYRDTRLTAAMVLPHDIIALDQLFRPPGLMMWLAASLVHLALS